MHGDGGLSQQPGHVETEAREDDATVEPEPDDAALQLGAIVAAVAGAVVADDEEARVLEPIGHPRRRLQEVVDALERIQPRDHRDHRRPVRQAELPAQRGVAAGRREARGIEAVADDADAPAVVAAGDEPALDRLGVDQHVMRDSARQPLHAPLPRREVVAGVADRRDHERRAGQSRGRDAEEVRVEAEGVDDVDAAPPEVTGEADLLDQRPRTVHVAQRVLGDRDTACLDLAEELPHALQAAELQLEP